jgi:hypothetical protein
MHGNLAVKRFLMERLARLAGNNTLWFHCMALPFCSHRRRSMSTEKDYKERQNSCAP